MDSARRPAETPAQAKQSRATIAMAVPAHGIEVTVPEPDEPERHDYWRTSEKPVTPKGAPTDGLSPEGIWTQQDERASPRSAPTPTEDLSRQSGSDYGEPADRSG